VPAGLFKYGFERRRRRHYYNMSASDSSPWTKKIITL
jgi:hypothetical protein